jgi:hypothetical protein
MLLKRLASAAVCACVLLALAPLRAPGQTRPQTRERPKAAPFERRSLTDPRAGAAPRLRSLFAESASGVGARRLTAADFERFDGWRQQDDAQPPAKKKGWTKGEKAIVIVIAAVFTAVCVWAIANPGDDPPPDCSNDFTSPACN